MFKAIFYKEWIKTRWFVMLIGVMFTAFLAYTFIGTAQTFRIDGAVATWSNIILKDIPIIPNMEWLPLMSGILLAITQFVPEMINKRLKLTLHLPLPETKTIVIMLFYGLSILLILYILSYIVILTGLNIYYPNEIIKTTIWTSLPWFFAGFATYIFAAWICIEPIWRQRIFNTLAAICALSFFFINSHSGAYFLFIPFLLLFIIISFSFPFYSAIRFKNGAQS